MKKDKIDKLQKEYNKKAANIKLSNSKKKLITSEMLKWIEDSAKKFCYKNKFYRMEEEIISLFYFIFVVELIKFNPEKIKGSSVQDKIKNWIGLTLHRRGFSFMTSQNKITYEPSVNDKRQDNSLDYSREI